ncbi:MAG TPA: nucleoside-diphosphate sugar epimerase/dehydratase [Moraxellaceae bacterium]|nr:nucleoside-diphosphate sugar epimerase/dehydratase [Moraxellaceae bacterium]
MRGFLVGMSRHAKVAVMVASDGLSLLLALWLSLSLRYGELWMATTAGQLACFAVAAASGVAAFSIGGLYRWMVRYVSAQTLLVIFRALLVSALVLGTAILLFKAELPRSTPFLYALIGTVLVAGSRFFAQRLLREPEGGKRIPVVIYGAGSAGHQIGLGLHQGNTYRPVAYVDDNPAVQGRMAYGLRVYPPRELPRLVEEYGVQQILLAMPSLSNSRRREILLALEPLSIKVRTVPRVQDIVAGEVSADQIQDVDPADLLGRDPVPPRPDLLGATITGKVVMVTGAGGSIGSELCRQIMALQPACLILFEVSEFALYAIESELCKAAGPDAPRRVPLLGSVQDETLLREVMQRFRVDTVFHAAAYKHVPLVEHNVVEGVRNNVFGTRAAARAALEAGVATFVLISTDKAVRPTNIMGASKRLAELVLQSLAGQGATRFCMVRFGNVLGSSGSVVPLFREQIRRGGPLTVTHPDIIRFFMTIPEAAQLVIQAAAMAKGGDVFLLDMGEPVRIAELAKRMIHLMGFHERTPARPDGEIAIVYTGLRPGEKLYEELLVGDGAMATDHPRIMRAIESCLSRDEVESVLAELDGLCRARAVRAIHECFEKLRIGFLSSGVADSLPPPVAFPARVEPAS